MLLAAIGASLPAALAIALSPFPLVGIVLILAGRRGRRNGPVFAIGWVVGLTIVAGLVLTVFQGASDPDSTSSATADWLRVIGGAALIAAGARKWRARPRGDDEVEPPRWMASLDDASVGRAAVLGAALSGANPKNLVLAAAATTAIIETGVHGPDLTVAVVVFLAVASSTVIGAVVLHLLGGARAAGFLDSVRGFMVANNTAIMVVILVLIGANVLGSGLEGLGR